MKRPDGRGAGPKKEETIPRLHDQKGRMRRPSEAKRGLSLEKVVGGRKRERPSFAQEGDVFVSVCVNGKDLAFREHPIPTRDIEQGYAMESHTFSGKDDPRPSSTPNAKATKYAADAAKNPLARHSRQFLFGENAEPVLAIKMRHFVPPVCLIFPERVPNAPGPKRSASVVIADACAHAFKTNYQPASCTFRPSIHPSAEFLNRPPRAP